MYGQLTNLQKPEVAEKYIIPYVITSLQQNQEVVKFIWKDKVTAHPHFSPQHHELAEVSAPVAGDGSDQQPIIWPGTTVSPPGHVWGCLFQCWGCAE